MENSFNQNRVYGWGELAQLYFPNISQKSATGQLLKWIRVSDKLMHDLEEAGWHPGLKYLPANGTTSWGTSENREEVKVIYTNAKLNSQLSTNQSSPGLSSSPPPEGVDGVSGTIFSKV